MLTMLHVKGYMWAEPIDSYSFIDDNQSQGQMLLVPYIIISEEPR